MTTLLWNLTNPTAAAPHPSAKAIMEVQSTEQSHQEGTVQQESLPANAGSARNLVCATPMTHVEEENLPGGSKTATTEFVEPANREEEIQRIRSISAQGFPMVEPYRPRPITPPPPPTTPPPQDPIRWADFEVPDLSGPPTEEEIQQLDAELAQSLSIDCACARTWCKGECEEQDPMLVLNNLNQRFDLDLRVNYSNVAKVGFRAMWRVVMWCASVLNITQTICFGRSKKHAAKACANALLRKINLYNTNNLRLLSRASLREVSLHPQKKLNTLVDGDLLVTGDVEDPPYPPHYFEGINVNKLKAYIKEEKVRRVVAENGDVEKSAPETLKHQDAGGAEQITVEQVGQTALTIQRDESIHTEAVAHPQGSSQAITHYNDIPQSISNVTDRIYKVTSVTWDTTQALGSILVQDEILKYFTTSVAEYLPATTLNEQYQYIVPQFTIIVQTAVAPMMSGCLIASTKYFGNPNSFVLNANSETRHAYQQTQTNHGFINAQSGNEIILDVPFRGPVDSIVTNTTDTMRGMNYCRFEIGVYSPLISASDCKSVKVNVYAKFASKEGPTQWYGLKKREKSIYSEPKLIEADVSDNTKTVDMDINHCAELKKSKVKVCFAENGDTDETLGHLLGDAFKLISNLDRPSKRVDPGLMQVVATPNMSLGKGEISLKHLRLSPKGITPHDKRALGAEDQMTFKHLQGIWTPIADAEVTTSMTAGTIVNWHCLGDNNVTILPNMPTYYYMLPLSANGNLSGEHKYVFEGPLAVLARHFAYWSGGLKYRLQCWSALSQAIRLRIYYIPNRDAEAMTVQAADLEGHYAYIVFDVKEQATLEFTVPFIWFAKQANTFGPVRNSVGAVSGKYHLQRGQYQGTEYRVGIGNFVVAVEAPLICTTATSKSVRLTLSQAADDDFSFDTLVDSTYVPIAYSSATKMQVPKDATIKKVVAEGGDVAEENQENEQRRTKTHVRLFPKAPGTAGRELRGEPTELKDCLRRFSVYYRRDLSQESTNGKGFIAFVLPVYPGPSGYRDKEPIDLMSTLSLGYRFFKGSMRYCVQVGDTSRNSLLNVQHIPEYVDVHIKSVNAGKAGGVNLPVTFVQKYDGTPQESDYTPNFHPGLATEIGNNTNNTMTVEAPWTSNYNCLINNFSPMSTFSTDASPWRRRQMTVAASGSLQVRVVPTSPGTTAFPANASLTVLRAFGDDAQFYQFQGFPLRLIFANDKRQIDGWANSEQNSELVPTTSDRVYDTADLARVVDTMGHGQAKWKEAIALLASQYSKEKAVEVLNQANPKEREEIAGALSGFVESLPEDFPNKASLRSDLKVVEAEFGDESTPDIMSSVLDGIVKGLLKMIKHLLMDVFGGRIIDNWFKTNKTSIIANLIQFLLADSPLSKVSVVVRAFVDFKIIKFSQSMTLTTLLAAWVYRCYRVPVAGKLYVAEAGDDDPDLVDLGAQWFNFIAPFVLSYFLEDEKIRKLSYPERFANYFKNVTVTGTGIYWFITRNIDFLKQFVCWALGTVDPVYIKLAFLKGNSETVNKWVTNVARITEQRYRTDVLNDRDLQNRVKLLKREGDIIITRTKGLNSKTRAPFLKLYDKICNLDAVVSSTVEMANDFTEPVVIWMAGQPGIGKSVLMDFLGIDILKAMGIVCEGNPVFTRNFVDYWNGYTNNPIVKYDDFTFNESPENMSRLLNEIQCLASCAPFNAPMAAIEEKQMLVQPALVMIGANHTHIDCAELGDTRAFHRRRDILVWIDWSQEFRDWIIEKYGEWRVPTSIGDICDNDEEKQMWNIETGCRHMSFYVHVNPIAPIPEQGRTGVPPLSYDQFKRFAVNRSVKLHRQRSGISEKIISINSSLTAKEWLKRGNEQLALEEKAFNEQAIRDVEATREEIEPVVEAEMWQETPDVPNALYDASEIPTSTFDWEGEGVAAFTDATYYAFPLMEKCRIPVPLVWGIFNAWFTVVMGFMLHFWFQLWVRIWKKIYRMPGGDISIRSYSFTWLVWKYAKPYAKYWRGAVRHGLDRKSGTDLITGVLVGDIPSIPTEEMFSATPDFITEETLVEAFTLKRVAHAAISKGTFREHDFTCVHNIYSSCYRYQEVRVPCPGGDRKEWRLCIALYVNSPDTAIWVALDNSTQCAKHLMLTDVQKTKYLESCIARGINPNYFKIIREQYNTFYDFKSHRKIPAIDIMCQLNRVPLISVWLKQRVVQGLEWAPEIALACMSSALVFGLYKVFCYGTRFVENAHGIMERYNADVEPEGVIGSGDEKTKRGNFKKTSARKGTFTKVTPEAMESLNTNQLVSTYEKHAFLLRCGTKSMRGFGLAGRWAVCPYHFFAQLDKRLAGFETHVLEPAEWNRARSARICPDSITSPGVYYLKCEDKECVVMCKVVQGQNRIVYHSQNDPTDYPLEVLRWTKDKRLLSFCISRKSLYVEREDEEDVALLCFPAQIPAWTALWGSCIKDEAVPYVNELVLFEMDTEGTTHCVVFKHCVETHNRVTYSNAAGEPVGYTVDGYSYPYRGKGLCGAPLCCNHTSKIIGFHIYGCENEGTSTRIAFETIRKRIEEITANQGFYDVAEDSLEEVTAEWATEEGSFLPLGCVPMSQAVNIPAFSDIKKSLAYHKFETTRLPVRIARKDDVWPGQQVCHTMIKKGFFMPPPIPFNLQVPVVVAMIDRYTSLSPNFKVKSVRTLQEAIIAPDDLKHFETMKLKSSCGYPLNSQYPGKNQSHFINKNEDGTVTLHPELEALYIRDLELRKKGTLPVVYYTEFPKDERLKAGKEPRLISGVPLQSLLAWRQYFADFINYIVANRSFIRNAIGINPWGEEWNDLIVKSLRTGPNFICADYKDFGPHLHPVFVSLFATIANLWYTKYANASDEDNRVRTILVEELLNCRRICRDFVYQTLCGSPSGSWVTQIINSFVNQCYLVLAWNETFYGRPEQDYSYFVEHFCDFTYGDDLQATVSDRFKDLFNNSHIQRALSYYDIVYTDADKTRSIIRPYVDISEASFLKYTTVRHPTRPLWQARMEEYVVEELAAWIRKSCDPVEATLQNLGAALRFAYTQGPKFFEEFRHRVLEARAFLGDPEGKRLAVRSWSSIDRDIYDDPAMDTGFEQDWFLV